MADDKVSYKSPYYDALDSKVEQAEGLKPGLLRSIRVNGEKSNADQVSSAGAQTVYQIIPATRDAAIKKWGIDPYLSPENAASVAGKLLKDSLDRHKDDIPRAVMEYNAGTDPKRFNNPETRAYVQRVTGQKFDAPKAQSVEDIQGQMHPAQSGSIANVYKAYSDGAMSPEEAAHFESDVSAGKIMLPRGGTLKGGKTPKAPANDVSERTPEAPEGLIRAWQDQALTVGEQNEFETDVRENRIRVPDTVKKQIGEAPGTMASVGNAALEAVSGARRETEESRNLRDYTQMPELGHVNVKNLKLAVRTLFGGREENVKAIEEAYPGVKVSYDAKGNPMLKSAETGQTYTIAPGLSLSDAPAVAASLGAFEVGGGGSLARGAGVLKQAGVNAAGQAAAQTAVEGAKAASGGDASAGNVLAAAAGGAALPVAARVVDAALPPVVNAVKNVLPGATERQAQAAVEARVMHPSPPSEPIAAEVPPNATPANAGPAAAPLEPAPTPSGAAPGTPGAVAPSPAVTQPAAGVAPAVAKPLAESTDAEIIQVVKKAAGGDKAAQQQLAELAAIDPEKLKAAERLGPAFTSNLQADQLSLSNRFREFSQAVKSTPGSMAREQEVNGLEAMGQEVEGMMNRMGGSRDLSGVNANVKTALQNAETQVKKATGDLYDELAKNIPAKTAAPADGTLSHIKAEIDRLGGDAKSLSPAEKHVLAVLTPKRSVITPATEARTSKAGLTVEPARPAVMGEPTPPTYHALDKVRREIGEAIGKMDGPFGTTDSHTLDTLYAKLSADQEKVAQSTGQAELWKAAKTGTQTYKQMQEHMKTVFGKHLEDSLVGKLGGAMKRLPTGDETYFTSLISAIPKQMRQEVVASGLTHAFGANARDGLINFSNYAKWFRGLEQNPAARNALFANLPAQARQQLTDLAKVAEGIAASSRERITTGRVNYFRDAMERTDSFMAKVYDTAKRAAVGVAAEAITTPIGLPGVGLSAGLTSALVKGKPSVLAAADKLVTSPEFIRAAKSGSKMDIQRLAHSGRFIAFRRAMGNPREMKDAERWIAAALVANKTQGSNK